MRHRVPHNVNPLQRVIVAVCSALILILAAGSLFMHEGPTEDPETHIPLDPRGAIIGIPIGLGGLVFSVAGLGFRRRRRQDDYRAIHTAQRAMPRVDHVDRIVSRASSGPQGKMPREQSRVFWTTPPRGDKPRRQS